MKAIFSPGPAYSDPEVRKYAGWVHILELYREGLSELGYEVFIPKVDPALIDQSSTVSKILSYDVVAAWQIRELKEGSGLGGNPALFLGPPGYSLNQLIYLKEIRWELRPLNTTCGDLITGWPKLFTYVWNNADPWRDSQLSEEYARHGRHYDLSPTWRWINRKALELSDRVIACSPWVKKTHAEIVPESKISIAFWGVDSQKYTPTKKEPETFRVLFVGGDPIRKGLIYLLQALEGLSGFELWIVGCAPLDDPVAQRLNARQFGMIPNDRMPEIYRRCSVLVCPTLEDGIALCVQEAMASGLPVITSPETAEAFTTCRDLYLRDAGIVVDYRNVTQLHNALEFMIANPAIARDRGQRARKLAESQTWDETKRQFKEIIQREMRL